MKQLSFSAIILLFVFASCGPHTKDCPSVPQDKLDWLVYNVNDTITFKNDANDTIRFIVRTKDMDPSYTENCNRNELVGYYCKECQTSAHVVAESDTHRGTYYRLIMSVSNTDAGNTANPVTGFEYNLFDQPAQFTINGQTISPSNSGQVLNSVTLGGTAYSNVFTNQQDTVQFPSVIIWKTYYNKQYGILGFEDKQTHSLFYRQ